MTDNPNAFPITNNTRSGGMSLRDYFAGQALAALRCNDGVIVESLAANAYLVADAMLKARTQ